MAKLEMRAEVQQVLTGCFVIGRSDGTCLTLFSNLSRLLVRSLAAVFLSVGSRIALKSIYFAFVVTDTWELFVIVVFIPLLTPLVLFLVEAIR